MFARATSLLFCAALLAGLPAVAQDSELELKTAEQAPPAELAESVRSALENRSIQLTGAEGPALEFWFRKGVPLKSQADGSEAALKAIAEGTLIGAVRFAKDGRDFRDNKVEAGVYTMRFALQPQDGDHMGTAPVPYFVLLTPAAVDTALEGPKSHDGTVELAQKGAKHPRNLNLRPLEETEGEFPRVEEGFDETKLVCVKADGKVEGGESAPFVFGVVFEGHGEL